jgi:hypothetical protein
MNTNQQLTTAFGTKDRVRTLLRARKQTGTGSMNSEMIAKGTAAPPSADKRRALAAPNARPSPKAELLLLGSGGRESDRDGLLPFVEGIRISPSTFVLRRGRPSAMNMKPTRNPSVAFSTLVRLWHVLVYGCRWVAVNLRSPSPRSRVAGRGKCSFGRGYASGARSEPDWPASLALGYCHAIPAGFQFG